MIHLALWIVSFVVVAYAVYWLTSALFVLAVFVWTAVLSFLEWCVP